MSCVNIFFHSMENNLSQQFYYIKLEVFNPLLSSITSHSPLRKKNESGKMRIFHLNTITGHFAKCCIKQSGTTLQSWQGEKQTEFLMSQYFIWSFSLVKSFSSPLPTKDCCIASSQVLILLMGIEDDYSHL